MQPLCSLHVLLLSQGQNWIAAGDCIFPYGWHVHCIMAPHVSLSCVPFSYKIVLSNWKERVLNSYFLILLTCLLTIITLGLSILRTPIYPLYAITLGFCCGHCSRSNATWLQWEHRGAFSFLSLSSIPQASCHCQSCSENMNESLNCNLYFCWSAPLPSAESSLKGEPCPTVLSQYIGGEKCNYSLSFKSCIFRKDTAYFKELLESRTESNCFWIQSSDKPNQLPSIGGP